MLAFGAGALISAVSFELAEEGIKLGDDVFVAGGLALGAVTYFTANRELQRRGKRGRHASAPPGDEASGNALALGAFLDGIPEQLVLGIGIAAGDGRRASACSSRSSSRTCPRRSDRRPTCARPAAGPGAVRRLWALVAIACTLATAVGYALADVASADVAAMIDGFAAGALLVMLVDSMIPESVRKGGDVVGLVTVLGFAVATGLSGVS